MGTLSDDIQLELCFYITQINISCSSKIAENANVMQWKTVENGRKSFKNIKYPFSIRKSLENYESF